MGVGVADWRPPGWTAHRSRGAVWDGYVRRRRRIGLWAGTSVALGRDAAGWEPEPRVGSQRAERSHLGGTKRWRWARSCVGGTKPIWRKGTECGRNRGSKRKDMAGNGFGDGRGWVLRVGRGEDFAAVARSGGPGCPTGKLLAPPRGCHVACRSGRYGLAGQAVRLEPGAGLLAGAPNTSGPAGPEAKEVKPYVSHIEP